MQPVASTKNGRQSGPSPCASPRLFKPPCVTSTVPSMCVDLHQRFGLCSMVTDREHAMLPMLPAAGVETAQPFRPFGVPALACLHAACITSAGPISVQVHPSASLCTMTHEITSQMVQSLHSSRWDFWMEKNVTHLCLEK